MDYPFPLPLVQSSFNQIATLVRNLVSKSADHVDMKDSHDYGYLHTLYHDS